jgi:hypothetical protein
MIKTHHEAAQQKGVKVRWWWWGGGGGGVVVVVVVGWSWWWVTGRHVCVWGGGGAGGWTLGTDLPVWPAKHWQCHGQAACHGAHSMLYMLVALQTSACAPSRCSAATSCLPDEHGGFHLLIETSALPLSPPCGPVAPLPLQIVHCCGYDSIPSDLGVLLLADHARKHLNT